MNLTRSAVPNMSVYNLKTNDAQLGRFHDACASLPQNPKLQLRGLKKKNLKTNSLKQRCLALRNWLE